MTVTESLNKTFILFLTLISFITFGLHADSKTSSPIGKGGIKRGALLFTSDTVSNAKSEILKENFKNSRGFQADYEIGFPFSVFGGLSYYENQDLKMEWDNSADTGIEFYGWFLNLGLRFTLPLPFIQPWIGAGYSWGMITLSNPNDRPTDDIFLAIKSPTTREANATFATAGLDFSFYGLSGLRIAYMVRPINTEKLPEIDNQSMDLFLSSWQLGFHSQF